VSIYSREDNDPEALNFRLWKWFLGRMLLMSSFFECFFFKPLSSLSLSIPFSLSLTHISSRYTFLSFSLPSPLSPSLFLSPLNRICCHSHWVSNSTLILLDWSYTKRLLAIWDWVWLEIIYYWQQDDNIRKVSLIVRDCGGVIRAKWVHLKCRWCDCFLGWDVDGHEAFKG